MSTTETPTSAIPSAVTDVLVNRRSGRFELAVSETDLLLRQASDEERIELSSIDGAEASINDGRVRLRFRTIDGAAWTLRWFDAPSCRSALVIDLVTRRRNG